jgi:peroxiredoxin
MAISSKLLNWLHMGGGHSRTLKTGDIAPEVRLETADESTKSLSEILEAGPALLAFYKVTCPTCQFTLPYLTRLQSGGAQILAVCQDSVDRAEEFAREFDAELPQLFDKAEDEYPASNSFGITHVPSLFLVEKDRRISWSSVGFSRKELEALGGRLGAPIFRPEDMVPEWKSG